MMQDYESVDWGLWDAQGQWALLKKASPAKLRRVAMGLNWCEETLPAVGWIMAQPTIDLSTALCVFFNAEPQRFNYLSKKDVPAPFLAEANLLDTVTLRINSGFYLFDPAVKRYSAEMLHDWLRVQKSDRLSGVQGRWRLEASVLAPMLGDAAPRPLPAMTPTVEAKRPAKARKVLPEITKPKGRGAAMAGLTDLAKDLRKGGLAAIMRPLIQ